MKRKLDTFQKHQKLVALQTLRLHDSMVSAMGGMTKREARAFLRSVGIDVKPNG
jgi:thermostable 8-oxoguanine DNA glycosylase